MKLTFYKQEATPDRVDKSDYMSRVGEVSNVILKDDVDLLDPTFILKTNPVIFKANYMYCDFTGRYYYITHFEALKGGRTAITAEVDVLHTFRNEILNSEAWVEVSDGSDENDDYNMLHNDFPFRSDYEIRGINLSGGDGWESPFNTMPLPDDKEIFMVIK